MIFLEKLLYRLIVVFFSNALSINSDFLLPTGIWNIQGDVNVTVNVLNVQDDESEVVDSFHTDFTYNRQSDYYILLVLTSEMTNTK